MSNVMLTTVDNPFNPFVQFDEWLMYDIQQGYNSCGLLARLTVSSSELSEEDQEDDTDDAIRRILQMFPLLYRLVDENNNFVTLEG